MSDDEHDPIEGTFTELASAQTQPPRWVIQDLLPTGLIFVGGAPKCNKSTLTMACACLVSGLKCKVLPPFLSIVEDHGPVLMLSAEASAGELKHMVCTQLFVDDLSVGRILIADDPFEWRLDIGADCKRLMHWLEVLTPKLVIIDPFSDFHEMDEKESGPMIRMLRPLRAWALKNHSCLVLVHHTRKLEAGMPNQVSRPSELRGSSAMFGKADGAIMVTRRDDETHIISATFKRGASWERHIQMRAFEHRGMAREVLAGVDVDVLKALEVQPVSDAELAKRTKLNIKRVQAAIEKLIRNGFIAPEGKAFHVYKTAKSIGL